MASSDNRLRFFVGLNTGYVVDGLPDQRCVDFYAKRASPQLHCAIVGNVVLPNGVGSNAVAPVISSHRVWRDLAAVIADRGSVPGIQLATAWEGYAGVRSFRSRQPAAVIASARALVSRLTKEQVAAVFADLEGGTALALQAGFRHIQLHAAHGYLFSLLADPGFNPSANEVLAMIANWAERVNANGAESSVRISLRTGHAAFDQDGRDAFLDAVSGLPISFVDITSGFYNIDKQLIYPSRPEIISARRSETIILAERHPARRFIYSGRASQQILTTLPPNIDIGLCRDLIANPNFLNKRGWGCANTGRCHYFSRGKSHITCGQWQANE